MRLQSREGNPYRCRLVGGQAVFDDRLLVVFPRLRSVGRKSKTSPANCGVKGSHVTAFREITPVSQLANAGSE
jgi:hypothetical protein